MRRWRVLLAAVAGIAAPITMLSAPAIAGTSTVVATADAYVKQDRASNNFGTATLNELLNSSTGKRWTYVKFPVTVPNGEQVQSASLALNFTKVPASETISVYATTNGWTETGITWNNKPAQGALQSSQVISTTGVKTFSVNVVAGDNSFLVQTNYAATNSQFSAREASSNRPTLTVVTAPTNPTNTAPVVNAGTDQTITLPATSTLDGTVTDDGLPNPPAITTVTWTKVSGPGTVTFGNANAVDTTATFSINGSYVLRLTASDSALSTSDDVAVTVNPAGQAGDPRAVFGRTDLLKGSQIGAWDMDGGLATSNAGVRTLVQNAGIKVVRWQMWRPPCELRATNCQTTADFNAGINTIRSMGAVPLIGLPPIWNEQCSNGPDPWSYAWQQWVVQHVDSILDAGGSQDVLFEMGNEPDNYCGMTGQNYFDQLWTNVPPLKAWARSTLGRNIFVGGPAWANSYTNNLTDIETWLTDTKNAYVANANNRDWIPDFVSTHTYLVTPTENDTQAHAQARIDSWGAFYDSLHSFINTTFAGLTDQGYPIADELWIVDSEYNDTIDNASTINNSQTWTDFYFGAMYQMFRAHNVRISVQFTIASHGGGALDLLTTSGTAKPEYTSLAAQ